MTKVLIINPHYNDPALPYFECAPKEVYEYLSGEGEDVAIIEEEATPEFLRDYILNHPEIEHIYGLGHGSKDTYTVVNTEPFLSTTKNLDLVKDRVISLLSCLTANDLGPAIVRAGAIAYFGYSEEVITFAVPTPCGSRFAVAPIVGDIEKEKSLHAKKDYEECYNDAISRWDEEIEYWRENYDKETYNGEQVTEELAGELINTIIHNRDCFTLILSPSPPPPPSPVPEMILSMLSITALGGLILQQTKALPSWF